VKGLLIVLGLIILVLQIRLLSSDGGVGEYLYLQDRLDLIQEEVAQQEIVNELLRQEVKDLQSGTDAIETIARKKLGMIGENEVFIQVIEAPVSQELPASSSQSLSIYP